MDSRTRFVITLVFSPDLTEVVLLHKLRGPEGVAGRINFPGGGIEDGETALIAGSREDEEELGIQVPSPAWTVIDVIDFGHAELTALASISPDWHQARSCTDEQVFVANVATARQAALDQPGRYAFGFVELLDNGLAWMRALHPENPERLENAAPTTPPPSSRRTAPR